MFEDWKGVENMFDFMLNMFWFACAIGCIGLTICAVAITAAIVYGSFKSIRNGRKW
jgi:ABC-type arginine/histidine transport system permease subunit